MKTMKMTKGDWNYVPKFSTQHSETFGDLADQNVKVQLVFASILNVSLIKYLNVVLNIWFI